MNFPLKAVIENDKILNLHDILKFLGTHPKLTHGDGKLVASVCTAIDYISARHHITKMQKKEFIRYAAFIKDACNCARFVTDTLINSVTNYKIKRRLVRSKWFTPSTVGNVLLADTENQVFEVTEQGVVYRFKGSQFSENVRCFLDRLPNFNPSFTGTLHPKPVRGVHEKAQWLSGIAAGAWFELHDLEHPFHFKFRRISPYGKIDVDAVFKSENPEFNYDEYFEFVHYSNCKFFHVKQKGELFRFERVH
ncbi:DUF6695 family protein [Aestuariibaculum sediminum]